MTYYNILFANGVDRMLDEMRRAEVDGIIVPDLPLEESVELKRLTRKKLIDLILLAAPTTSPVRLVKIANSTSGFLYLVSVTGITGARPNVKKSSLNFVSRAKGLVKGKVPIAVGFGVSEPEHVRSFIKAGADGVVVGSAIVDRVSALNGNSIMYDEIERFVSLLKSATKIN
jgi:tryptophan synthase alpha chain